MKSPRRRVGRGFRIEPRAESWKLQRTLGKSGRLYETIGENSGHNEDREGAIGCGKRELTSVLESRRFIGREQDKIPIGNRLI